MSLLPSAISCILQSSCGTVGASTTPGPFLTQYGGAGGAPRTPYTWWTLLFMDRGAHPCRHEYVVTGHRLSDGGARGPEDWDPDLAE